jgi:hypothetical protein
VTEPLRDDPTAGVDDVPDEPPVDDQTSRDPLDATEPGLPPPTAIESLVSALLEAGPDVAEHVVRAAQELLLAAQCIVDAADQAVQEQLDVRDLRAEPASAEPGDTTARVLPLDLGE